MVNCEPRCTDEEADRIWTDATESLLGSSALSPPPPSASSFTGGNTLKVTAELAHPSQPNRAEAKVAIDTQSDVTTALREYLTDVRDVIPDLVSGLGGDASFSEEGILHVWSQGMKEAKDFRTGPRRPKTSATTRLCCSFGSARHSQA
jgi:hypothetical protein